MIQGTSWHFWTQIILSTCSVLSKVRLFKQYKPFLAMISVVCFNKIKAIILAWTLKTISPHPIQTHWKHLGMNETFINQSINIEHSVASLNILENIVSLTKLLVWAIYYLYRFFNCNSSFAEVSKFFCMKEMVN